MAQESSIYNAFRNVQHTVACYYVGCMTILQSPSSLLEKENGTQISQIYTEKRYLLNKQGRRSQPGSLVGKG